ncbi:MAG: C25 family cysteine peptidase, partial [candidate division Zixibacteria bacterium]|nr:C25 family cysteine peptidase [candidate division Zixibacteria bacterium]
MLLFLNRLCLILALGGISKADSFSWDFSIDSLQKPEKEFHYRYPGLKKIPVNAHLSLPVMTAFIETDGMLSESDFVIRAEDRIVMGGIPSALVEFDNRITGFGEPRRVSLLYQQSRLIKNIYDIQKITSGDKSYWAISILPVTVDANSNLVFTKKISLVSMGISSILGVGDFLRIPESQNGARRVSSANRISASFGIPLGYKYIIITTPNLASSFKPLIDLRNATDLPAAMALTDSISAHYDGIDQNEKIRNYLKDVWQAGGQYILIGGNEINMPARYLYYYNTSILPGKYELMPSDLYFADLTGDWDRDGDGIWGEPNDDIPDLHPELLVGRLPVQTAQAVEDYISKLIAYYTNPGKGDYAYLTKSLFFASDEMRDYPTDGQHGEISKALPSYIEVDTSATVEIPSGADPAPVNANGANSIAKISEGFGIINIIAHGRVDGFMVKSANYGDWPASLILTSPQGGGHGSLDNLQKNEKTSLYYSLACDGGGYDLDTLLGPDVNYSLVEKLVSLDSAGAVGMVANARWGWVYSSYLLQQSFMKYLFGSAQGNPAQAMYFSWLDYPYLRDIIYGQNYFGDTALKIFQTRPSPMELSVTQILPDRYQIFIQSNGEVIGDAAVSLSLDGAVIQKGITDQTGQLVLNINLDYNSTYTLTAAKGGYTLAIKSYSPSIATDVKENKDILPGHFQLAQNYPNPFN